MIMNVYINPFSIRDVFNYSYSAYFQSVNSKIVSYVFLKIVVC